MELTKRQYQLAKLVWEGLGDRQIGYIANLEEGTVKVYLAHLKRKLGYGSRVELALRFERGEFTEATERTSRYPRYKRSTEMKLKREALYKIAQTVGLVSRPILDNIDTKVN